jgi:iron complex outermembrane recepter protein
MRRALRLCVIGVTCAASAAASDVVTVAPIDVEALPEAEPSTDTSLGAVTAHDPARDAHPDESADAARLLLDSPGVGLRGNGAISSLPVIHGLADDRLQIRVDGVELATACPNHMNSPLSYVDPSTVGKVTVFAGATPVSVGGDNIGGTVQVTTTEPTFANGEKPYRIDGQLGSFYRSNGNGFGYHFRGGVAGRWLGVTYSQSTSQSDNYVAGGNFKPVSAGREGAPPLPGNEVGSSAHRGATNRTLGVAMLHRGHSLRLDLSRQTVDFEGYPNQRMDMTANDNRVVALRYRGEYAWGDLLARASYQQTDHSMDMGPDRYSYGTGMPMRTRGKTRGAGAQGNVLLSDENVLRLGGEYQEHTLFDWWDPVGISGSMGPNTFHNIDYGRRLRLDAFAEWEATWSRMWASQIGMRSDTVLTNAGPVQGYNNSFNEVWAEDAATFNAAHRDKIDKNWDVTALIRFTPRVSLEYLLGYSRKSRSPNLYQRYAWAQNPMASLMNNLAGDGNGYSGNLNLRPEVAHTLSLGARWRDAAHQRWELNATSYFTYVERYIDAERCDSLQCSSTVNQRAGFVILRYVNQPARIHGIDVSGRLLLAKSARLGTLTGVGMLSFVNGKNLSTGDGLYDIMPLNAKLRLQHSTGALDTAAEVIAVAEKNHVSRVRNEIATPAYWLLNLRASYRWEVARLDLAVENLLNRLYFSPLSGAYVGQGPSMTTSGIPWGVAVPGRGRSFDCAFNYYF